jgi:hypothetical protein
MTDNLEDKQNNFSDRRNHYAVVQKIEVRFPFPNLEESHNVHGHYADQGAP